MNWQTVKIITRQDCKTIASKILSELRHERRLTQAQFAEWLEIPKRTYEKWESGENVPPNWIVKLIQFKCDKSTQGEQLDMENLITVYIRTKNNAWEQIVDNSEEMEDKIAFWKRNGAEEAYAKIYKRI